MTEVARDVAAVLLLLIGVLGAPIYAFAAIGADAGFMVVLVECGLLGAALGRRG